MYEDVCSSQGYRLPHMEGSLGFLPPGTFLSSDLSLHPFPYPKNGLVHLPLPAQPYSHKLL